jgi:hypothetical protein
MTYKITVTILPYKRGITVHMTYKITVTILQVQQTFYQTIIT